MTAAAKQIEISSSSRVYRNLIETCRSPSTRILYSKALRYFMSYLHLPNDAYDRLVEKEPKLIQMDICDFITPFSAKAAGHLPLSLATSLLFAGSMK